jgi:hypothetical protein
MLTECNDVFQDAPFDPSRTWAVIIGINAYVESPLNHAGHDALCFKDYLLACGVSRDHICLLMDDVDEDGALRPTRNGILDALHDLRDNSKIKHGDTIIVSYSGHGVAYYARSHWPGARGRIEALAPVDRGGEANVPDISDRELNLFLTDLARSKGNNITVILDCCFGSGTFRTSTQVNSRLRCTKPLGSGGLGRMLKAAESYGRKCWRPGLALSHPDIWKAGLSSHVTIRACHNVEGAYEDDVGGAFTSKFLQVLRDYPLTLVSYQQLVGIEGLMGATGGAGRWQVPLVTGDNADCLVFRIPQRGPK